MNNLCINISEKYGPDQNQVKLVKNFLKYNDKHVAELEKHIENIRIGDPIIFEKRPLGTKITHSVSISDYSDTLKIIFVKDI